MCCGIHYRKIGGLVSVEKSSCSRGDHACGGIHFGEILSLVFVGTYQT